MNENWSSVIQNSQQLAQLLIEKQLTIAVSESCTGGGIAYALTEIAGSSAYFTQSWVTYSNQSKINLLGVNQETLNKYGAVSQNTVKEMVSGILKNAQSDIAIATSGIAGPGGATENKPVGLVCFGFKLPNCEIIALEKVFAGDRRAVREQAIDFALETLIKHLLD